MAMTINTNIASVSAQRHLNASRRDLDLAMERLSSGQRINSAKDDAAGLAIRDKMSSQIVGLNQSIRNANDAISLAQTAEGAMEESVSILQRMRVLAMQAVNDTNTDSDRANLNDEFTQLQLELTRIGITSSFNNVKLLDGTFSGSTFQVGPGASETIFLKISDQKANAIGTTYDVASFDIFAANSPAKGDSLSLTIRGADGDGGDLTVTYKTAKAETAIQTASGMVLALNSNPTFTQKYQALSDANNSILIRRTDGTSMGLPVRAQFDVAQAQVSDTVTVTVDGVATGGAAKDFTYTVAAGKTSATDISTGVAKALNADENGFGRFYKAYASSYASTDVTLTVGTAIENNETAAITLDGTTFTTAKLSANATASDIGDAFAALSETGWDISNNKGVVTFYKNADYSKTGETGQSVIATADVPTVTIGGSGSGGPSIKESESIEFTAGAKDGDAITFTIGAQEHIWTADRDYATAAAVATAAAANWNNQTSGLATGYTATQANTAAVHSITVGGDIDVNDQVTIDDGIINFTHAFATTQDDSVAGRALAAAELKTAIDGNAAFSAVYDTAIVSTAAVHTIDVSATGTMVAGTDSVTLNDTTIAFTHVFETSHADDSTGNAAMAAELKTAIEGNAAFDAAYAVTVSGTQITLTEKVAGVSTRSFGADASTEVEVGDGVFTVNKTVTGVDNDVVQLTEKTAGVSTRAFPNPLVEPNTGAGTFVTVATTTGANANATTVNFQSDTVGTAGAFAMTTSVAQQTATSGSVTGNTSGVEISTGADATYHTGVVTFTIANVDATDVFTVLGTSGETVNYTVSSAAGTNATILAGELAATINGTTAIGAANLWEATVTGAALDEVTITAVGTNSGVQADGLTVTLAESGSNPVTNAHATATTAGINAVADGQSLAITSGAKSGDTIKLELTQGSTVASIILTADQDYATAGVWVDKMVSLYNSSVQNTLSDYTASKAADGSFKLLADTAGVSKVFTLTGAYTATSSGTLAASASSTEVTAGTDGSGSGAVTATAVDKVADGKVEIRAKNGTTVDTSKIKVDQLIGANTESKIINEHTGFEVTVTSKTSTAGDLSVSKVVDAVDVFVNDIDVLSASAAMGAVRVVDDAVAMIGRERAGLGAFQNRLEHAMSNMANNSQNTQAARSVIADADYAKEAANLAKNQILQQAGTAMLAQANSQSETVLSLLK